MTTRSGFFAHEQLQSGLRIGRRVNDKIFLAELQLQQPPHFGFVFDDEDCCFFFLCIHVDFDAAPLPGVPTLCQPAAESEAATFIELRKISKNIIDVELQPLEQIDRRIRAAQIQRPSEQPDEIQNHIAAKRVKRAETVLGHVGALIDLVVVQIR